MKVLPYDKTNPYSIESYAKLLIGHTFADILEGKVGKCKGLIGKDESFSNPKRLGGLGNLLEKVYFEYDLNSDSKPDFEEAEVELKTTPYEINKSGKIVAGERLVLSMINYNGEIENSLEESHLWKKCKLLLLIFYLRDKSLQSNLQYPITYVSLFSPSEVDKAIIEEDYKYIADKIINGKAETLSEADTCYLGACTKGQTAEKSLVRQYYPPHTLAKKRAFCYKNSYMTQVLNEYITKASSESVSEDIFEPIIKDASELKGKTFAKFITSKIDKYIGYTDVSLCKKYDREYNNNKAQWTDLSYRMLGIKSNRAEEFRKANITVKVIRIEENGKMKENISFPPFKYLDLINEEWDNSTLYNYFFETKFLFVVFKKSGKNYILKGSQLWNMPIEDLNCTVKDGWTKIVNKIKEGIAFELKDTAKGIVVTNNLPKKGDNNIIHIRPHAHKRYFKFTDGTIIGDGTQSDANPLPDGTWMPNYSFWINNSYILKQLNENLLK